MGASLEMATVAELESRLETLKAQRDSAVARVSYDEVGRIDAILQTVGKAIDQGTYLAISPQFVVTATA
jgi:hypothetical protein